MYFQGYSAGEQSEKKILPTVLLIPEEQSDGSVLVAPICLERVTNPLFGLHFTDFSIRNLLQAGVSPKALSIVKDERHSDIESEIDAFNNIIIEHRSELINL